MKEEIGIAQPAVEGDADEFVGGLDVDQQANEVVAFRRIVVGRFPGKCRAESELVGGAFGVVPLRNTYMGQQLICSGISGRNFYGRSGASAAPPTSPPAKRTNPSWNQ